MKDQWAKHLQKLHEKEPDKNPPPNWVSDKKADKIIEDIKKEHPDAQISYDAEHFIVIGKSGKLMIARWLELPHSSDGEIADSYRPIKEVLEESLLK